MNAITFVQKMSSLTLKPLDADAKEATKAVVTCAVVHTRRRSAFVDVLVAVLSLCSFRAYAGISVRLILTCGSRVAWVMAAVINLLAAEGA